KATEREADRLAARIKKAGDLILGVGRRGATGAREKRLQATYAADRKALGRAEGQLKELEERIASVKANLRKANPASWTAKEERQYKAIEKSEMKRGRSKKSSKRIAAATVNKQRGAKKRNPSAKSWLVGQVDQMKREGFTLNEVLRMMRESGFSNDELK